MNQLCIDAEGCGECEGGDEKERMEKEGMEKEEMEKEEVEKEGMEEAMTYVDGRFDNDGAGGEFFAEALRPAMPVQVEDILVADTLAIRPIGTFRR